MEHLPFNVLDFQKASSLEREFSEGEIKSVVFDKGGEKAHGPDGFPMVFFQRVWEHIKEDYWVEWVLGLGGEVGLWNVLPQPIYLF